MGSTTSTMSSPPKTLEETEDKGEKSAIHMMRGKCKKTLVNAIDCSIEADKNNENIGKKCLKVFYDFFECAVANQDHYGDYFDEMVNEKMRTLTEKECFYCGYMKDSECKETYINWQKCVEEAKKNNEDIATKCVVATSAFKKCIEADQDYCSREKSCCKETRNFEVAKQEVTTMSSSRDTLKSLFSDYQSKTTEEYLKGGECKEAVIKLKNCIDEAKKNNEDTDKKCSEVSWDFINCMKANQDYYGVSLQEFKYGYEHNATREEIEKKRVYASMRACVKDVECKKRLTDWKNCVEGAKKNGEKAADKCYEVTFALTNSMKPDMNLL